MDIAALHRPTLRETLGIKLPKMRPLTMRGWVDCVYLLKN